MGFIFDQSVTAVLGRFGETGADSTDDIVDLEVAPVDHAIDCYLGEAIKAQMNLLRPPTPQGLIHRIQDRYCPHSQPIPHILGALLQIIPIPIAILIEQIHILHPLLNSLLSEDRILSQLLHYDLLPHVRLRILVVIAAVRVKIAVLAAARRAVDGLIERFEFDMIF
jgi:hypothetical protein